jgi:hypothetical protein
LPRHAEQAQRDAAGRARRLADEDPSILSATEIDLAITAYRQAIAGGDADAANSLLKYSVRRVSKCSGSPRQADGNLSAVILLARR